MNKSNLILASTLAIIFTSILIIFSPTSQKLNFSSSVPSPTSSQSISPTPNPAADWKTYINPQYRFSLRHPLDYLIEENIQNDHIQLIFNKGKANSFFIKAEINYLPSQPKYYLDTLSNGTRKIGEITWNTFYLPEGYENIGTQEITPIYAIQLEQDSILYSISGFTSSNLTAQQLQILSTFKFTP